MKKLVFLFGAILLLVSCKNEVVEKPEKLIDEDQMVNIIYDLSILEAMKYQSSQSATPKYAINPKEYIYKKYHIDSLQFARSNHYYASDMGNYKKMYDKVNERIKAEQKQVDALIKTGDKSTTPAKGPSPDGPQIQ
jgi:sensor c-di-GMP phosphodiesterase-like protein